MDIDYYQKIASQTDQKPLTMANDDGIVVPLLGMAGEVGSLQAAYKKKLRDGDQYRLFSADVAEELGDIAWYVANLATKFEFSLSDVLAANLGKVQARWPIGEPAPRKTQEMFDHSAPDIFQLPRTFAISFAPTDSVGHRETKVQATWNGEPWGDSLGDNSYMEDGYRFHDVHHLANAAVLGWSPVARKMFGKKRKYDESLDGVEDSGRAIVVEEGIVAFVYGHASRSNFFAQRAGIDWATLKTIRSMTDGFEVAAVADWEWERAVLQGYEVWRALRSAGGGTVIGDLYTRTLRFEPL